MDIDIFSAAEEILGPAVRVEVQRGWATFWCPFHNDADRAGQGGHPNFGVHLRDGYWKCLHCGASGGSLKSLRYKLGKGKTQPLQVHRLCSSVPNLGEAGHVYRRFLNIRSARSDYKVPVSRWMRGLPFVRGTKWDNR